MESEMFEREREWLQRQPGMNPWTDGCRALGQQIDGWIGQHGPAFCEEPVTEPHPLHARYSSRLWECWCWHWSRAAAEGRIDGRLVAQRVGEGRDASGNGDLGGNPLRDMVLAVAMRCKENKAAIAFQSEYREFCRRQSARYRVAGELDQWWNELLDHLAGYTREKGKLDKYGGHSALSRWLRLTLWNFLKDWLRRQGRSLPLLPDEPMGPLAPDDNAQRLEIRELLTPHLLRAIRSLSKRQRLVLYLRRLDNLQWQQIGPMLSVDKGTACRICTQALREVGESTYSAVLKQVGTPDVEISSGTVAQALQTDQKTLAEIVWQVFEEILDQARQEDESASEATTQTAQEQMS